jgi:hypothetical protein
MFDSFDLPEFRVIEAVWQSARVPTETFLASYCTARVKPEMKELLTGEPYDFELDHPILWILEEHLPPPIVHECLSFLPQYKHETNSFDDPAWQLKKYREFQTDAIWVKIPPTRLLLSRGQMRSRFSRHPQDQEDEENDDEFYEDELDESTSDMYVPPF